MRLKFALLALVLVALAVGGAWFFGAEESAQAERAVRVERLTDRPIIRPKMLRRDHGDNINGPSLIRAPDWLPSPLGKYYLYFADHGGKYIRLAYADRLEGPWSIYKPGVLHLRDTPACRGHIASPDVHVDELKQEVFMYFHCRISSGDGQKSFLALSADGLAFDPSDEILATSYLRVLPYQDGWFGVAGGGVRYWSSTGVTDFQELPNRIFPEQIAGSRPMLRHVALHRDDETLFVYFTRTGDSPERIMRTRVDLSKDRSEWLAQGIEEILRPETKHEGANLPITVSEGKAANGREHALRDPAIYVEDDRVFLLYSVAGESGISIAEIKE